MPNLNLPLEIALISGIGLVVYLALRIIRQQSRKVITLVLAGTLVHALSAGLLFVISWADVAALRGLHSGDGFWTLAPDARLYYELAAEAASQGIDTIRAGSPSPTFVTAIAVWMSGIGIHPATPLLFNLLSYIVACACVLAAAGSGGRRVPDRAIVWPIAGLSFAPILLFCGTQVLKDTFFTTLTVVVVVGARELFHRIEPGRASKWMGAAVSAVIFIVVIGLLAGVRAYYPVLVLGAFGSVAAVAAASQPRRRGWRYAAVVGLVLLAGWGGFRIGAGFYYELYGRLARNTISSLTGGVIGPAPDASPSLPPALGRAALPMPTLDAIREGFVLTGGNTSLVARPDREGGAADGTPATPGEKMWARLRATGLGFAAILLPVTALQALSIVDLAGGRGLLLFADLDTVVLGLLALGVIWTLHRERRTLRGQGVYLAFCLLLTVITGLLLAYVVTNLGSLVRLRLLIHVPLWMSVLAASSPSDRSLPDGPREV